MISAKNIYNSKAYKQMKLYAKGDKLWLRQMVEQFVVGFNIHSIHKGKGFRNSLTIIQSFHWDRTPLGHRYWAKVHHSTIDLV